MNRKKEGPVQKEGLLVDSAPLLTRLSSLREERKIDFVRPRWERGRGDVTPWGRSSRLPIQTESSKIDPEVTALWYVREASTSNTYSLQALREKGKGNTYGKRKVATDSRPALPLKAKNTRGNIGPTNNLPQVENLQRGKKQLLKKPYLSQTSTTAASSHRT